MEYIDLDLPSGTLWAKCNLGAEHEWETGKYYQWGDTVGYEGNEAKAHSIWETTPFNNGSSNYNEDWFEAVKGKITPNGVLHKKYDAAYQATNGQAHMPTEEQLEELVANTISKWTKRNNIYGMKFVSKSDSKKYIFIPASGYFSGRKIRYLNGCGVIWSNTLGPKQRNSCYLGFYNGYTEVRYGAHYQAISIRGVLKQN